MDQRERLDFVVWHCRAAMLQHSTLETCILTTKMLCHLIPDLLGMRVLPLGVGVIAANRAARISIEQGATVTLNQHGGEVVLMCSHRGMDADQPGEWWGGHLVLIADGRYIVDGSADQFSTPQEGMVTKPFVADLGLESFTREWLMSEDIVGFELPDGACLGYEPHLEDTSYRPSMDWDETKPGDLLYDHVAERVGGLLAACEDFPLTPALLPPLPPTLSRKAGSTPQEIMAREFDSALALGYSLTELTERSEREESRNSLRVAKVGLDKVRDATQMLERRTRQTAEAVESMEPKLRQAIEAAAQAGRYYSQVDSPLASSPPSSP